MTKSNGDTYGVRLSGKEARQGEIILKSPLRRVLFVVGLVAAAALVVGLAVFSIGA